MLKTINCVLNNEEIKEMLDISNILLNLKNSDIKQRIIDNIISNIKSITFHNLIYIVSKYKLTYDFRDNNGNTLLIRSCIENNIDMYISLLMHKLNNPNDTNDNGYNVLHYIAYYSKIQYLIIYSTHTNNFDCTSNNGETPLHIACKYGNLEFVDIFLNFVKNINPLYNGKTPILIALENNRIDIINVFLNYKRFNINDAIDSNGNTLLHYSCKLSNDILLDLLLSLKETKNLDINILNIFKISSLYYAQCINNKYACKKLKLCNEKIKIRTGMNM